MKKNPMRPLKRGDTVHLDGEKFIGVVRLVTREGNFMLHLVAWENTIRLPSFHSRRELILVE